MEGSVFRGEEKAKIGKPEVTGGNNSSLKTFKLAANGITSGYFSIHISLVLHDDSANMQGLVYCQ